MSDESDLQFDQALLSALNTLRRCDALDVCPMCRKDVAWIVLVDGITRRAYYALEDKVGDEWVGNRVFNVLPLQCGNCGFIATHAVDGLRGPPKNG